MSMNEGYEFCDRKICWQIGSREAVAAVLPRDGLHSGMIPHKEKQ